MGQQGLTVTQCQQSETEEKKIVNNTYELSSSEQYQKNSNLVMNQNPKICIGF